MFLWFQGSAVSWSGGVKEPVSPMGLLRYHWINFGMFSGCSMNWEYQKFIESYPSSTWNSSSYSSSTSSTSPAQKPYKILAISSNQIDINCRCAPGNVLHKFHNTWVFTRFFLRNPIRGYGSRPQGQRDLGEEYSFGSRLSGAPGQNLVGFVVSKRWLVAWHCGFCFGPPNKRHRKKGP